MIKYIKTQRIKMIDLYSGSRNKEIEERALKQGFSEVLFVKTLEHVKEIDKKDKEKYDCYVLKTENLDQLRRMIDVGSNILKIIVLGKTNEINRIVLENKKVFALLNPDFERKKDFLDSRDSGLNQVLCKIARDNDKIILVSLDSLTNEKSLGRIIQNFRLCKKFKTKIQLVNLASSPNLDDIKNAFELKEIERVLKNSKKPFFNPWFLECQKCSNFLAYRAF